MDFNIIDVTLRDGSYEVNFQFSQEDLKQVGCAVQRAGIKYIEIGHGQGLNASSKKNGFALCTDEEYLQTAQEYLHTTKYGFFCIPGIARLEDLDLLKKYGASFVRVGCNPNVEEVKRSLPYIYHAKELGLETFANYMKTYSASPEELEACIKLSNTAEPDNYAIVDSAGCMFPEDIKMYFDIIKNNTKQDVGVGFHGHDNLGYSIANSIYAAKIGCKYVDTSLQSLGRGAGNASTEQFIAILIKKYNCSDYKLSELMQFSEDYLRSKVKFKGVSGLDTYCGIAGFHSGYMNSIRKLSAMYHVSPYDLILEYSKKDRVHMDETLLENIAAQLSH